MPQSVFDDHVKEIKKFVSVVKVKTFGQLFDPAIRASLELTERDLNLFLTDSSESEPEEEQVIEVV